MNDDLSKIKVESNEMAKIFFITNAKKIELETQITKLDKLLENAKNVAKGLMTENEICK